MHGKGSIQLKLRQDSKIHFHISQLKRAVGQTITPLNLPAQLTHELELPVNPKELKDVRTSHRNGEEILKVLIKGGGLSEFEATWEESSMIQLSFLAFYLEDNVHFGGPGIAMNSTNPPAVRT